MNGPIRTTAVALVVLAATLVPTSGASAQLDVDDLSEAEEQLAAQQEQLQADIDAATAELNAARTSVSVNQAEIALIARDEAAAHHVDREATRVLQALVVQRYVLGDPRVEDFINEVIQEKASVEPAISRAIYAQALDSSMSAAEAKDEEINSFAADRQEAQDSLTELNESIPVIENEIAELEEAKGATDAELETIRFELEWERSLLRRARLTGLDDGTDNEAPVLAIKIDNVSAARPQTGINQADVVFEELVEGDLTRLVALFHSNQSNPVGPIRSVRTSDVHILANLNSPLLANSGGNPGVMEVLGDSPIVDVGALSSTPGPFFRDGSRPAPHNLMSNTEGLWAAAVGTDAGAAPPMFSFRRPDLPWGGDAAPVSGVNIDFGSTRVSYRWDAGRAGYLRAQDGSPHLDSTGQQVAPTNLIVLTTSYSPTPFAQFSPEAQVTGEGPVLVFEGGEMRSGTWKRDSEESPTRYLDQNGDEIELLPGTTWIALAPEGGITTVN